MTNRAGTNELVEALEYIDGCFVPGRRVTYGDPSDTLDRIRARANDALATHRGQCRVCHGLLEGAPGPECAEDGCPERDGGSA